MGGTMQLLVTFLLKPRRVLIVRWLNAKFRLDRDKSDKSMKFGTQYN